MGLLLFVHIEVSDFAIFQKGKIKLAVEQYDSRTIGMEPLITPPKTIFLKKAN